jgi:hypothetical protein
VKIFVWFQWWEWVLSLTLIQNFLKFMVVKIQVTHWVSTFIYYRRYAVSVDIDFPKMGHDFYQFYWSYLRAQENDYPRKISFAYNHIVHNKNREFTRLRITNKTINRLNIYIAADDAIIRSYDRYKLESVDCHFWWWHNLSKYILSKSIVYWILDNVSPSAYAKILWW